MGYYEGIRENPCPRCGGIVYTLFISVTPMSYYQRCAECRVESFSEEEEKLLGSNKSLWLDHIPPIFKS